MSGHTVVIRTLERGPKIRLEGPVKASWRKQCLCCISKCELSQASEKETECARALRVENKGKEEVIRIKALNSMPEDRIERGIHEAEAERQARSR